VEAAFRKYCKQQAASSKQQEASSKQRAASSKQRAASSKQQVLQAAFRTRYALLLLPPPRLLQRCAAPAHSTRT